MKLEKVAELLDRTCAKALNDWWNKTDRGLLAKARAFSALQELEECLRKLERPDYNFFKFTPPAYVVSYQLSHINLAWKAFTEIDKRVNAELDVSQRRVVQVVDFGSGTAAGRIGMALMAADAIERGREFNRIYFDEIDTSQQMLTMGELVWNAFVEMLRSEFTDTSLAKAVAVIEPYQYQNWREVPARDYETWLTAFHVTYSQSDYTTPDSIESIVGELYQRIRPVAGAFSCYAGKDWNNGHRDAMNRAFPFPESDSVNEHQTGIIPLERCSTGHTIGKAMNYGFRKEDQSNWHPFWQVRNCAILFGKSTGVLQQMLSERWPVSRDTGSDKISETPPNPGQKHSGKATEIPTVTLEVGNRVRHATFGPGKVESIAKSGRQRIRVNFDRCNYPVEVSANELKLI